MQEHLQAIVTVLSLINPLMCGVMFVRIEGTRASSAQLADATKAALAVLVILVLAALCGARILQVFGVSLDAFSVAGGGVLSWIGFSMLQGNPTGAKEVTNDGTDNKAALTPLILFAASPGTITGVVTLAVAHTRLSFPVTALVAVSVAAMVMWCTILLISRLGGHSKGRGFVQDTATRFMGLIVIAMVSRTPRKTTDKWRCSRRRNLIGISELSSSCRILTRFGTMRPQAVRASKVEMTD
jgi:multiple antibiotic resistance protein